MGRLLGEPLRVGAQRTGSQAVRRAAKTERLRRPAQGLRRLIGDSGGQRIGHKLASGVSGLATAGSGDVLTGVARGHAGDGQAMHWTAACRGRRGARPRGAGWHSERLGPSGIIATDVIGALPEVLR